MGLGTLIGYLIIIILLILSPIIFYIFRKNGRTKIGTIISGILILVCLSFLFTNTIDSFTHTKNDVVKDLKYANIKIIDDFEIIKNEVVGMPERFQKTILKITDNDRNRIIREIENEENFEIRQRSCVFLCYNHNESLEINVSYYANYNFNGKLIRESYFKKEKYVPIIIVATLSRESNYLEYERIEN